MGFTMQEHWHGLPCAPPGNLPDLEIKPMSPAWTGWFFTTSTPWEAPCLSLLECKMWRVTVPELAVRSKASVRLKCLAWCIAPGRPSMDGHLLSVLSLV